MKKHSFIPSLLIIASLSLPLQQANARGPQEDFADTVQVLMPAVVNISTTQKLSSPPLQQNVPMPQFPPGSPFEEFNELFEKFGKQGNNDGEEGGDGKKAISLGSGFIIDPSGYIVTNNHVIAEAEEISITLSDDTQLKAKVIGRDSKTDLALLKVEPPKPLPSVKFGDSDKSRVGEWVIAIGNPFGLGGTVTAGIISARARDINAGPFDDFIQTDASINKGNSGGPMFNTNGEVIGVNTAIYSPSGGSVGIGFATPANMAKPVIEELRKNGRIKRAWLGVKIQNISSDIADSLGLKEDKGALVAEVNTGSPAAKAGIEVGDVILSFDGKEIAAMRKLPRIVADTPIGKTVDVELLRKGTKKQVRVTLAELTEKVEEQQAGLKNGNGAPSANATTNTDFLGITLAKLTQELRSRYSVPAELNGLLVLKVKKTSEAGARGVQAGDVLQAVNQTTVTELKQVEAAVKAAKAEGKKSVLLLINRRGDTQFVPLPIAVEKDKQ